MSGLWGICKGKAGKAFLLFAVFAGIALAVHLLPAFDEHRLADFIRGKGAQGIALYIAATALCSAVGVPRQGVSFVGGYVFGALWGVIFATIGTTCGCALGFSFARRFGRPYLPARFASRMERLNAFLSRAPFSMALTIRCLPVGNNALTSILAGISTIPALGFIAGSCLGYIPQNFIFALLGSGMRVDPFWRIFVSAILFIVALCIGWRLYQVHWRMLAEEERVH